MGTKLCVQRTEVYFIDATKMSWSMPILHPPALSLRLRLRLLLSVRPMLSTCLVQPIKQTYCAEAHDKLFVMQVMHSRQPSEKVVPRMYHGSLQQLQNQKRPERDHMTLQYDGW